jgi:hypothetical protein
MARSTLNTTGESRTATRKGHGTRALGPSDSSDSGSDVTGGPGLDRNDGLPLARGTTSDPDVDSQSMTAGPDLGDADLDSDSDRYGTGERGAAGRDSTEAVDQTLTERDRDDVEAVHESVPAREAVDVESDDRPDLDFEAAEEVGRRKRRSRGA